MSICQPDGQSEKPLKFFLLNHQNRNRNFSSIIERVREVNETDLMAGFITPI